MLGRILDALRRTNGQATGRLHREQFGDAVDRDRFERLVGALVRSGLVFERVASFEKDGKTIEFRRLFLSAFGREASGFDDVLLADAPATSPRRGRRTKEAARDESARVARREASPPPDGPVAPDPALVEALRAWRTAEARRRQVPAFCVFSNRTLEAIALARPLDESALLRVRGVGSKVVERYREVILGLVRGSGPSPRRP